MAAGRGEFYRSFWESYLRSLERRPGQPAPGRRAPGRGRRNPGPGAAQPGPGGGEPGGKRRRKPAPRRHEPTTKGNKTTFHQTSASRENFMERLPPEVLFQILSYLDASSLSCISHVSKLLHRLANDNVLWYKIYMLEFGSQTWKPKSRAEGGTAPRVDSLETQPSDWSEGHWKKMYFRADTRQEMNQCCTTMKVLSPYTGLPRHTERVLRKLDVSWELGLRTLWGQQISVEHSRVYFFESSMIVRWSGARFPRYHHLSNIQLYGVRKETPSRRPGWRSLILKLDTRSQFSGFIGTDRLVRLRHLRPGFIVGTWRGNSCVAFIMACLHFHKLVEKSLLGSPVCPYSVPANPPPVGYSDPEFGLHGYTLHFVLHGTGSQIMSGHFQHLTCSTGNLAQHGLLELRVINRNDLSQHRSLSGNIKLPWKGGDLEGTVENCCIVSLTLLEESQKPFWCVSSPICITKAEKQLSSHYSDYSGEHFLMDFQNSEGRVKMELVWLKEQRQFFLISLTLYLAVFKINKHFRTAY
ncbi:F-box only protein 15-like isoform X2 [Centropristis striata]|uniref:F-box only protein 15-like isoform X2 n=1 Tax=Centropristis striata TaxID=184440 RepID=UPI0027E13AB3|nr:F-box only protein 15-like isoform X2 [Centropristis striata]